MTVQAALRDTWVEIMDPGFGFGVAWVTPCACNRRHLLWTGSTYAEARRAAESWADTLGGLPVLDRARLN
ncbi:hypothetical protein [Bradyrhizobium sp. AZCC 2289]|uniref:hypothetical protein n=1 Tax=Bradyrhizobium sp. AZCC 2289 TaxID=3117026 RepID=UPI002FF00408